MESDVERQRAFHERQRQLGACRCAECLGKAQRADWERDNAARLAPVTAREMARSMWQWPVPPVPDEVEAFAAESRTLAAQRAMQGADLAEKRRVWEELAPLLPALVRDGTERFLPDPDAPTDHEARVEALRQALWADDSVAACKALAGATSAELEEAILTHQAPRARAMPSAFPPGPARAMTPAEFKEALLGTKEDRRVEWKRIWDDQMRPGGVVYGPAAQHYITTGPEGAMCGCQQEGCDFALRYGLLEIGTGRYAAEVMDSIPAGRIEFRPTRVPDRELAVNLLRSTIRLHVADLECLRSELKRAREVTEEQLEWLGRTIEMLRSRLA